MGQFTYTESQIADDFRALRDGDLWALSDSILADSGLLEPCFLNGEPRNPIIRGQAMTALLTWAVDQLRPTGTPDPFSNLWRHYLVTHGFYFEGQRVADIAEKMGIAEQTFYEWRNTALGVVRRLLLRELRDQTDLIGRERTAMLLRYGAISAENQTILQLLTLTYGHTIRPEWIATILDKPTTTHELETTWLVLRQENCIRLQPVLQPHLQSLVTPDDRRRWRSRFARLYEQEQRHLLAARHRIDAGDFVTAAENLIAHQEVIAERKQFAEARALLPQLEEADFSRHPDLKAKLHLFAGRIAESLDDLEAAANAYGNALAAPDLLTKATAYHRRAKVYQRIDLDICLSHYALIIDMLERTEPLSEQLAERLARLYIDRAWVTIQERPDGDSAEIDLTRAENRIPPHNPTLWCDYYNARSGLAFYHDGYKAALPWRHKAWIAARETRDPDLQIKTAYNLGHAHVWTKSYEKGLRFLTEGRKLATETGNRQMLGVIEKGLGIAHFFQQQYIIAADHYQRARAIWLETGNRNWQANSCYDLAELHAVTGDYATARIYFEEGFSLARALNHARYLTEFNALAAEHPGLRVTVNERQQKALHFLQTNEGLTRQQYIDLTGVSKSQAWRDLEELLETGLLQRVGKGRALAMSSSIDCEGVLDHVTRALQHRSIMMIVQCNPAVSKR